MARTADELHVAGLVTRARDGDASAFPCLVERYAPDLRRFCRRLMNGSGAAEDLAQETFLRAYASLPRLEAPERFAPWLFAIAANLARWWWRQRARWPVSLDELADAYPDVNWQAMRPAPVPPDQVVEEAEQARRLAAAIEALPPRLARVLVLHYLEGLSYTEVAAALDVPVSTVKGRLFESRVLLRRELDKASVRPAVARSKRRKQQRKGTAAMAAIEQASEELVPVVVDSVRSPSLEPTADNLRLVLERRILRPTGEVPTPDLSVAGQQAAAALAGTGVRLISPDVMRVILLMEAKGQGRWVPIRVGEFESFALAYHQQGKQPPRPLTHDLTKTLLDVGGVQVEKVTVTRVEAETYYATITVRRADGQISDVDARPSDAINLAVRMDAPIYVAASLLNPASEAPNEEGTAPVSTD